LAHSDEQELVPTGQAHLKDSFRFSRILFETSQNSPRQSTT
jgi:hypothetical protein